MDKLQDFSILMNSLTGKTIIFSNQGKKLPPYPFITFQSIDMDREKFNILNRELLNEDLDVKETSNKNVTEIVQIDFYDNSLLGAKQLAKDFIDAIEFKYRREINEDGFGVINIDTIIDNTSLEQVKSLFRYTCDVTIDYTEEVDRVVENLQSVTFKETEDNVEETVTRE